MASTSLSPTKVHPPPQPAALSYVPAHRTDDEVFQRRYLAIRTIIHELEDENNLIAYRIAKLKRWRREEQEQVQAEAKNAAEAHKFDAEQDVKAERIAESTQLANANDAMDSGRRRSSASGHGNQVDPRTYTLLPGRSESTSQSPSKRREKMLDEDQDLEMAEEIDELDDY